ncbi:CLUMA_CG010113, isoform A [Clunio marinus]|uniref:CLUMA_CG010113, isoform A n=1 Tax=Clunio marinus TaxID=568069 RepID=A0A1J1IAU7_9DIPT|nr:CLUMA_CG010113, isoform A [Clunio marinus]
MKQKDFRFDTKQGNLKPSFRNCFHSLLVMITEGRLKGNLLNSINFPMQALLTFDGHPRLVITISMNSISPFTVNIHPQKNTDGAWWKIGHKR